METLKVAIIATFCVAVSCAATQHGHPLSSSDIPQLGLGTWLSDRDKVSHVVEYALNNGYRHVDSAFSYHNEGQTGKGIAAAGVAREDIWVTSKLWNDAHRPDLVRQAAEASIADLGVDYLDLYLVHWPVAFVPGRDGAPELDRDTSLIDTWRALEELVRANLTRYIGVSNFARHDVQAVLDAATIQPYAHELEAHPYLQQQDFVDWHTSVGVRVIAYSPLGNTNPVYRGDSQDGRGEELPPLLQHPFWHGLAESKNATVAQTVLAWGIQRGTIVIPKTTHEAYVDENRGALDIHFSPEELAAIAAQDKKVRLNNPGRDWGVELFADLDDPTKLGVNGGSNDL